MNVIKISVSYPTIISAMDTGGQWITIRRKPKKDSEDYLDTDKCIIDSFLEGDEDFVTGTCTWGEAFTTIQKLFGLNSGLS